MKKSKEEILKEIIAEMRLEGKEFDLKETERAEILKHLNENDSNKDVNNRIKGNRK